ncbi:MAG: FecR domain-containing protein [Pyrinomonadaceae bacterium]|nr:FecR domain-containing protein [Pyrinomonadaceae bacterium]
MIPAKKFRWAFLLLLPVLFLNSGNIFAQTTDDDAPDITARTARIGFLSGEVQIKRADQTVWERAVKNLPIVEGDEIATEPNARLEIQFDTANYLRLSQDAYLKVTTLRDEGIALSLPNGTLSLRVLSFDKDRSYFEIDAPGTTVSVERAGMYRVDAGNRNNSEVRVAVTDSGQARVFSENSGFTLKNGRSATVQLAGNYAGEWETTDASRFADDFDTWALERDAVIAKRLRDADYDKYYDRDFYGAEDLSEYGEWIYTKKYGYVWKPYRTSTASYADWSPYRYGQWRWVPPYGWTWVNDESWGYATYHHGRWVYDNNDWYWSPYSQHRGRRSWWRPALVVVSYIAGNICWYPLPYSYGYYNYNSYYIDRRRYNTTIINNNTTVVVVNPTPNPTPRPVQDWEALPPTGVTTVAASDFGRNKIKFRTAPADLARKALESNPTKSIRPPALPTFKELDGDVSKDILVASPKIARREMSVKTGATVRTSGVSTGETLRSERILGNRPPIEKVPRQENQTDSSSDEQTPVRSTGAVKRQPRSASPTDNQTPIRQLPNKEDAPNGNPIRQTGGNKKEDGETQTPVKPRRENRNPTPPIFAPTPRVEREERIEKSPPPRRERQPEPPREQEPVRPEPPRREERQPEPVRVEPPRREEPVRPPPKQDPPPEKPASPSEIKGSDKDG